MTSPGVKPVAKALALPDMVKVPPVADADWNGTIRPLNPDQKTAWQLLQDPDMRTLFWLGGKRSGKGVGAAVCLVRLMMQDAALNRGNGQYAVAGQTIKSWRDTNGMYLEAALKQVKLGYVLKGGSEYIIPSLGATVFIYGGGDDRRAGAVSGMTLTSGWIDEAIKCVQSFIDTFTDRLSFECSRLIVSTNSSTPLDHVYERFVKKANKYDRLLRSINLGNAYYSQRNRDIDYAGDVTSPHARRMLFNEWVTEEGQIYARYDDYISDEGSDTGFVVVDPGIGARTAALYFTRTLTGWNVSKEYLHVATGDESSLSAEEHVTEIEKRFTGATIWVYDSADRSLRIAIHKVTGRWPRRATKDRNPGIRATLDLLGSGKLTLSSKLVNLFAELDGYSYKKDGSGPDDSSPHDLADCLRYGAMHILRMPKPGLGYRLAL